MAKLPLTPLGRIIKNGGAERVSEDAKIALSEYLEDISTIIAEYALENASPYIRYRSVNNLIEEISLLWNEYKFRKLRFNQDL